MNSIWTVAAGNPAKCPNYSDAFTLFCPERWELSPTAAIAALIWGLLALWLLSMVLRYRRLRGKTVRIEKESLDRLHLVNSLLDSAMEYADMEFFRCDANGKFLTGEFFTGKFWGKDARGNFLPAEEWIYPRDLAVFVQSWQRFASGQTDRVSCSYRAELDGKLRYFELCAGGGVNLVSGERFISGFIREVTRREAYRLQLQDANSLLACVLDNLPVSLYTKSVEQGYRYVMCSQRTVFFPKDAILGKTDFDIFGPGERARSAYEEDCRLAEDGREITRVETFAPEGREPRIFRIHKKLLKTGSGERLILALLTDITGETADREQLTDTSALLGNIISHLPGCLFVKNAEHDFRYEMCNENFARLLGVQPDEVKRKTDFELWSKDAVSGNLRRGDLESLQNGDTTEVVELPDAAGIARRFQLVRCRLNRARGDRLILGLGLDISTLQRLQQAEYEKLLLIDSVRIPIMLFDSEHRLMRVNNAAREIAGLPEELIYARPCYRSFCQYPEPPEVCPVRKALEDGHPHEWEVTLNSRDYHLAAYPVLVDGKPKYVLKTLIDVTEANHYRQTLAAALDDARQANRAKDLFLATVGHQLRTPLNGIIGFSELFKKSETSEADRREYLEAIHQSGDRLLKLLDDLMELVRLETSGTSMEGAPCDLGALVRAAANHAAKSGRNVRVSIEPEPLEIVLAQSAVERILRELLDNAVKFTLESGAIDISVVVSAPGRLELRVADDGAGIAPEALPHLFDPFYQQDHVRDTHRYQGSGLGLAIVRRLTAKLGGTIRVESPGPGRGSRFIAEFPFKEK